MNPILEIDSNIILHNLSELKKLTKRNGVSMSVVTKGLVGYEPLVRLLVENGADSICEAHIQNLIRFKDLPAEKWMIRSPLMSEVSEVVRYADVSMVSENIIIECLSAAAVKQNRMHKVVIIVELGELREGCMPHEIISLAEICIALPGIELYGIGANLSCVNEIIPDERNMTVLADAAFEIERELGVKLPVVSGGSTSTVRMLEERRLPSRINHLRFGEAVLFGTIACYNVPFIGARTGAFTLFSEIIEVKEKPSVPWGERVPASLPVASDPAYKDIGLRKRALIAVGKQDIRTEYMIPLDPNMVIIGDTCDCFIADVTDCEKEYKPGDTVSFSILYHGLVTAIASDYVEKILLYTDSH
jgi:predicted amino acid racemase